MIADSLATPTSVALKRRDIGTPLEELPVGGSYRVSIAGSSVPFLALRLNFVEALGGPGDAPRS